VRVAGSCISQQTDLIPDFRICLCTTLLNYNFHNLSAESAIGVFLKYIQQFSLAFPCFDFPCTLTLTHSRSPHTNTAAVTPFSRHLPKVRLI